MPFWDVVETAVKWFAGAGVLAGIGKVLHTRRQKKIIRRHLYEELLNNWWNTVVRLGIATSYEGIKQGTPHRFPDKLDITFDMYNAHTGDPDDLKLFNQLEDAGTIRAVYSKFIAITNETADPYHCKRVATEAAATFEDSIKNEKLDRHLLYELARDEQWAYIESYLNGDRPGYREFINPF